MKESIPCENCGRYYGHTNNCLSFIIKSSSGHRMDVLEKLQAENAKLKVLLKDISHNGLDFEIASRLEEFGIK